MLYFGMTDKGKKRVQNQDSFICAELEGGSLLCAVCDGMGGAAGGNIASTTAVGAFSRYISEAWAEYTSKADIDIPALLTKAAESANNAVFDRAGHERELTGMGTTLTAALITAGKLYIANIGDSRLYMDAGGSLVKLTRDHSFVQYLVDIGQLTEEEAAVSPHRNIITRAVGSESEVETDTYTVSLDGDGLPRYVLICSDGLTNYLSEEKIHEIISACPEKENAVTLEKKVKALIDGANKGGGGDNITAVVIKISADMDKKS